MQYFKCRCGKVSLWSSISVAECDWCQDCQTTPAQDPESHRTTRPAHKMMTQTVETDGQPGHLTRCIFCHKTQRQLHGQPMEKWEPPNSAG